MPRSLSHSASSNLIRSTPPTPTGAAGLTINMSSPTGTPTGAMVGRGSFSGGTPTSAAAAAAAASTPPPLAKRNSVFALSALHASSVQSNLQRIFTKLHEEIYTVIAVTPKSKPLDVLASFGVSHAHADEQPYYLVLTASSQMKKSTPDGVGAPKLHWVKVKPAETVGGEVTYNYKKFKQMRLLKRIEMAAASGAPAMIGVGSTGAQTRREKEEFTLVFRSGDTDKSYSFTLRGGGPSQPATGALNTTTAAPERVIFVWYCLEICRHYCGFVPTSNIDTVVYQQMTSELTSYYLADPPPAVAVPPHLRHLFLSVSKNRTATAELDSQQLSRNKIEEKVIVPSMTMEETQLVQHFLKQIEHTMQTAAQNAPTAATVSSSPLPPLGPSSSHFYLNDLESFLTQKLALIEQQNIQSLFDPHTESLNARILQDDIQTNLLDNKLEEMSMWINHHNIELGKMKKGIEMIEKRNLTLDIQEKNQTRLFDTLKSVLDSMKLDADPTRAAALERLLDRPDFGGQLTQTMHAVKQLDHVLGLEIADGKLEEIAAIKEQRTKYAAIKAKFSRQAEAALDTIFQDIARKAVDAAGRDAADATSLQTNASVHRDLRRYIDLVRYLERLEFGVFLQLRAKYCTAMRSVYEVKTRLYFASLRRAIAQEHKESHLQHFPDWTLDLARQATRRTESGRNVSTSANATYATLLRTGPNCGLPQQQTGKIRATQAFVQALANMVPCCLSEEKFLHEFFGASPEAIAAAASAASAAPPSPFLHSASTAQLAVPSAATTSATPSSRPRVSFNGGSGVVVGARSDAEELNSMMHDLFRGLEPELRELSSAASKMDHFYTLEMLVQCERMVQEATNSASSSGAPVSPRSATVSIGNSVFLEGVITSVSTHLKLSFTSFVDGEIEWLTSLKPNPKRCGVLQPMVKFPAFVDRMENVVCRIGLEGSKVAAGADRSQSADTSYQKLASALFRWLDGVAKSDEKYTDVVSLENAHFFLSLFSTPHLRVPALAQFVSKAEVSYTEHMRLYVNWSLEYEMPSIYHFWQRLEEQLKSIQPEDIPFASELSKHDLRAITKGPLAAKALQKSLANVIKRVQKHMPMNPALVHTTWLQVTQTFLSKLSRFDHLVGQCYQNEKLLVTHAEVAQIFQQLTPNATAKAQVAHTTTTEQRKRGGRCSVVYETHRCL